MLQRDPVTKQVSIVTFSPNDDSPYTHPKFGEITTKLEELQKQRRKETENGVSLSLCPRPPELPILFRISPAESLLLPKSDVQPGSSCANASDRPGLLLASILPMDFHYFVDSESPFMNRFAQLCRHAGIRRCESPQCIDNWKRLEQLASRCDWISFRDWALQVLSCQATMLNRRSFTRAFYHLHHVVDSCHYFLVEAKAKGERTPSLLLLGEGKAKVSVDAFGAFELVYWMMTIQNSIGGWGILEQSWDVDFLPSNITEPAVANASQQAGDLGICQYRLWNLIFATERGHLDLPAIMESAVRHPGLRHEHVEMEDGHRAIVHHRECTPVYCKTTALDSTRVRQLHKCKSAEHDPCKEQLLFDPEKLNRSIRNEGRTVWSVSSHEVSQHEPYIAISHVWSDGTGVGVQAPGLVNRCLFESLARIAERLECPGIWWDSISIPNDPALRTIAINNMHENYAEAKCTVLHDRYLLNFEWTDDGAPCLAIIFSPWLTRGWTALELIMSKTLKVLFKNPDGGEPLIKDLDEDILAKDPATCTRGHWVASTVIRRLRQDIRNVSELIATLKPRSTSWARDRLVIAGLLSGVEVNYKMQPYEITKKILDRIPKLNSSSLYHGQPTLTSSGGWSWCPPSLYEMPSETVGDLTQEASVGEITCVVDGDGVLAGCWYWRPLEKEDGMGTNLLPISPHISINLKTREAIRRWEYCMLLREKIADDGLSLIVIPAYRESGFIHVKFVGSVREVASKGGSFSDRFDYEHFKIGVKKDLEVKAKKFWKKRGKHHKTPSKPYTWICGQLWVGNHDMTGQLLLAQRLKGGIIEGYSVRVEKSKIVQDGGSVLEERKYVLRLSDDPVFRVWAKSGLGVEGDAIDNTVRIRRVKTEEAWPPTTIPAFDRIYDTTPHDSLSSSIFTLKNGSGFNIYATISPKLSTADEKHPYRGIWIFIPPGQRPLVALFHQPYPTRLEVVALTGYQGRPRGSLEFVVEDLADIKQFYDGEGEWKGRPVVRTSYPVPDDMPLPDVEIDLLLADKNEVIFLVKGGWTHFHRAAENEFLDLLAEW